MTAFEQPGEDMGKENDDLTVTERTRVPIGIAVACVVAFIGGALWLNNSLARIDRRLEIIETKLLDRWTSADMRLWAMQLRIQNQNLTVPEVERKQ